MSADSAHSPDGTAARSLPTIPGYHVVQELGRGGTGIVYEARQQGLDRTVALKLIRGLSPKSMVSVRAQADAVAAVCHPNVVQIYDHTEHDGLAILAFEYVPGGNLATKLQDVGRMSGRPTATLVASIARGIASAHAQQLVHGDLKSGTILLDESGEPKVADIGFARKVYGTDGVVMGQPVYVAPELMSGTTKFIGPAVDIWSIGVIMYECMTGRRPFQGDNITDLALAICTQNPERPTQLIQELSPDLEAVCMKCLAKNPTHRYHSAADLADDLNRFLAGEAVHARVPVPAERLVQWARRNKLLASLTAALLILSVVGLVGSIFMWQRAEKQLQAADVAREQELNRIATTETALTLAEQTRASEQKRADDAIATLQAADRTNQELAGTAADLIGLIFTQNQMLPLDANNRKIFEGAVATCRRAVASPSTTPQMKVRFSTAFIQVGRWFESHDLLAEASELYRESIDLVRPAAISSPKDRQAASQLAVSLAQRGAILARLGKAADALPLVLEADKLDRLGMGTAEGADRPFWKSNLCLHLEILAGVYRSLGRREESARTLQDAKGLVQNADQIRLIAGGFALLAAAVPSPGSPDETKEKERYLAEAIETLRIAVEGGWRHASGRAYKSSMVGNADFKPFQDHPEVKKLLADAAKE